MNLSRALAFAAAVTAGGLAIMPNDAQAREYPFCAVQGGYTGYQNCGYPSFAACRAAVSGVGGQCIENPRFRGERYENDGSWDDQPRRPSRRY